MNACNTEGLIDYIEKTLVSRYKAKTLVCDVDFIAGASAAIQFLIAGPDSKEMTDAVPAYWFFDTLAGKSLVAEKMRRDGEREAHVSRVERKERDRARRLTRLDLDHLVRFLNRLYEQKQFVPGWIVEEAEELLETMGEYDTYAEEDNG